MAKHTTIAHLLLTDVQTILSSNQSILARAPQFICCIRSSVMWNIPSVSLGQPSWLRFLTASCAPAHRQSDGT